MSTIDLTVKEVEQKLINETSIVSLLTSRNY